nr:hypothetical protein CFP56_03670 [Quercus suber]
MVSSVVLSPVDEIKDGDRFDPYLASFDNKRRHAAPLLSIAATQREDAKRRKKAFDAREMELAKSIKQRSVFARVENSRLLIINTTPKALRDIYSDAKTSGVRRNAPAFNTDVLNSGPGTPITYGKEHILCHPEIEWVHRGQGRYLPASDIQKDMPPPAAGRMSR